MRMYYTYVTVIPLLLTSIFVEQTWSFTHVSIVTRTKIAATTTTTTTTTTSFTLVRLLGRSKQEQEDKEDWNEQHLAHGIAQVHEETNVELRASEQAAAVDAHDALDAGMEAAAEERAVMLAAEMTHRLKMQQQQGHHHHHHHHHGDEPTPKSTTSWNDLHLAHYIGEVHEEDDNELLESEIAAAFDAHDAPDAGMEAAAEEWAVMLAAELTHKLKQNGGLHRKQQQRQRHQKEDDWNEAHLAHGIADLHEEDANELRDSEEAAAVDAHDAPDAGMEAAAEERAVMLAAELAHKLKQQALAGRQANQ